MKGLKAKLLDQMSRCRLGQSEFGTREVFALRGGGGGEMAVQPPEQEALGFTL